MLDASRADPEAVVARLSAAGFDAFSPKVTGTQDRLFPSHLFVVADPEMEAGVLSDCAPDVRFVMNDSNRPMPIPDRIAAALCDPASEEGRALSGRLAVMAPEYRIDSLCQAVTRRH